jgi:hypothetical protein
VASTPMRRPLPALIALLALFLLTALVWFRVLHRDTGSDAATPCPTETSASTLPGPNRITVEVLNATDRNGIAGKARTTLVSDGFNVPSPAHNDKSRVKIRGVAEIRYGPRGVEAAKVLRYYLPKARLVSTKAKTSTVVLSLGEKYRGVASPSSVTAKLKHKQIELDTAEPGEPSPSPTC